MQSKILLLGAALLLPACGSRTAEGIPVPRRGDVIVVDDDDDRRDRSGRERRGESRRGRERARSLGNVPPGHYPPPGECRIWYVDRPPGHQPPPARCSSLAGRVPYGAFLLYNGKAWDTEYDWRRHERRRPGSVPDAVLRLMDSLRN